jgi:predicted amidohydrolase
MSAANETAMASGRLTAGVVQMTSRGDLAANLVRAEALIGEAVRRGAELVVLPENFAWLAEDERRKLEIAEAVPGDGPILAAMTRTARRLKVALVLGGMPERSTIEGRIHNTAVCLDASGGVAGSYRKIHLFDVAIPDGATYRESASVAPGEREVVVDTPWGGLGLSVCYDLRFPELYRALGRKQARMLVVPAAFTQHTGRDHWHVLLRSRAIENLSFVLAAAQYGRHTERRVTYGHSLIVDPWGQILAEVGDHEGVAVAELDFAYQDKLRRELPALDHRRL